MKSKLNCLVLFIGIIFFTACQHELNEDVVPPITDTTTHPGTPADTPNSITGTWDFISLEAYTQSEKELAVAGSNKKTLSYLNYLSTDNAGTILIDDSAMYCTGITYKISSQIKTYNYRDNVITDSSEVPYVNSYPATDSYTPYKRIGYDSIFFKKGGFANISAVRFRLNPPAAKIIFDNNNLKFVQDVSKDSVEVVGGISYHTVQRGEAILTLRKKQ